MTTTETFERLKRLRRQEPFKPFVLRTDAGDAAEVVYRLAFAFNEKHGCAYDRSGRWMQFKLDGISIEELDAVNQQ